MITVRKARYFLYRGENVSKKFSSNDVNAQEWLNTLGGFGVTLNIEGNPYIPSSNAYLSSFLEHADSVASQEIRSVLEKNIEQNNQIIDQQKQIWASIARIVGGDQALRDLLNQRIQGDAFGKDYGLGDILKTNPQESIDKSLQDLNALELFQKDIRKKTDQTEKAYRSMLTKVAKIFDDFRKMKNKPNFSYKNFYDYLKQNEPKVAGLEEAYYQEELYGLQSAELEATYVQMLNKIADSLFGSDEDRVSITSGTGRGAGDTQELREIRKQLRKFKNSQKAIMNDSKYSRSRRQRAKDDKNIDISRYFSISKAQLKKMDTKSPIRTFVEAYHALMDALIVEKRGSLAKAEASDLDVVHQIVREALNGVDTIRLLSSHRNQYSETGINWERVGNSLATYAPEIGVARINKDPGVVQEVLQNGHYRYNLTVENVGQDKNRSIIQDAIPGGANSIETRIEELGALSESLINEPPYLTYTHHDKKTGLTETKRFIENKRNQIRKQEGKIDTVLHISSGQESYNIAFSDKLYNIKNMREYGIMQGDLLTNLISLDSGKGKMDNRVLYLLLLNLSSLAAFYASDKSNREKVEWIVKALLSQNFFAAAFDPSNINYDGNISGMNSRNTLYIANFTGQLVPLYSILTTINNYMNLLLEDKKLNDSPLKITIDWAEMGSDGEGMYQEAYDTYPPKTNDDISKTARWHYVAQQVAKNTKLDMVFNMIAFNALYMGFYEK